MPVPPELFADLYDLYLRAAVELGHITFIESDELRYLRRIFGLHLADVEEIRQTFITTN
jgi:hypothetical protein